MQHRGGHAGREGEREVSLGSLRSCAARVPCEKCVRLVARVTACLYLRESVGHGVKTHVSVCRHPNDSAIPRVVSDVGMLGCHH